MIGGKREENKTGKQGCKKKRESSEKNIIPSLYHCNKLSTHRSAQVAYIMLSIISQWLQPASPGTIVEVVRIPADGSPAHLLKLQTIDIKHNGNVDCFLSHIPDFRLYWGYNEGWNRRGVGSFTARGQSQSLSELNGLYLCFKNFAVDDHQLSGPEGFCGDMFVVKVASNEYDDTDDLELYDTCDRVIYEDISPKFFQSSLMATALKRLSEMQ